MLKTLVMFSTKDNIFSQETRTEIKSGNPSPGPHNIIADIPKKKKTLSLRVFCAKPGIMDGGSRVHNEKLDKISNILPETADATKCILRPGVFLPH